MKIIVFIQTLNTKEAASFECRRVIIITSHQMEFGLIWTLKRIFERTEIKFGSTDVGLIEV